MRYFPRIISPLSKGKNIFFALQFPKNQVQARASKYGRASVFGTSSDLRTLLFLVVFREKNIMVLSSTLF